MSAVAQPVPLSRLVSPVEKRLRELMAARILILDGAMGTMIQRYRLTEEQFRGERFADHPQDVKGNNELLSLTRPSIITEIHEQYLAAGADLIETNTFGATAVAQADYRLARHRLRTERRRRRAWREPPATSTPRRTGRASSPARSGRSRRPPRSRPTSTIRARATSPSTSCVAAYLEQARGLVDGGVDLFLVETIFDTLNAKACLFAIDELHAERARQGLPPLPIMISGTVTDASGRILSGQTVEAFWNSVRHARPLTIGLNCALGAALMRPYIEELSRKADTFVCVYPNAGLPNPMAETGFDETPDVTSALLKDFAQSGFVNIAGGCCGTTPEHIAAIAEAVDGLAPRKVPAIAPAMRLSGLEPFNIDDELAVRQRRRAHQRHRLEGVRAPDPQREVRRGAAGGAPAGRERRPGHRRQHGRGDARFAEGDDALPEPDRLRARHLARADHDRQLQVERHRGGPEVRAGQGRSSTRSR